MLELATLLTPYADRFGIRVGGLYVVVTLLAHLVFGAALGFWAAEVGGAGAAAGAGRDRSR